MQYRLITGIFLAAALTTTGAMADEMNPPSAASTGCSGNVLLADDFTQIDPAWTLGDAVAIVGGKLQIKAPVGYGNAAFYSGALFGNADMCVDIAMPEARDQTNLSAGLVFHFADWDNNVRVIIAPNGYMSVQRTENKETVTPMAWRKVAALKTNVNDVNSIRATWKGATLAIYVNGQYITTAKLIGLTGKGTFGLVGYSEKAAPNIWRFSNLKIAEPPK